MTKEHCENCGCGHDHDHEHEHDNMENFITLTMDDGTEVDCYIFGSFDFEGKEYIVLQTEEDDNEGELLIYEYIENDDGTLDLLVEEDDEKFKKICDEFERVFPLGEDEEDEI